MCFGIGVNDATEGGDRVRREQDVGCESASGEAQRDVDATCLERSWCCVLGAA